MTKKVAIFGGSFDPPTLGHLMVVLHLILNHQELDHILIVPSFQHPEKKLSDFEHRVCLCYRTFSNLPEEIVKIDRIESTISGPSYTYLTLGKIKQQHPDWELFLVLGSDLKDKVADWIGWEEVVKLATPLIVDRAIAPTCSSTRVRSLLKEGKEAEVSRLMTDDAQMMLGLIFSKSTR